MRDAESRRPPYHYEITFPPTPRAIARAQPITPSPLSRGPGDPLIWTHFQIDARGRLTLPRIPAPVSDSDVGTVDDTWLTGAARDPRRTSPAHAFPGAAAPAPPSPGAGKDRGPSSRAAHAGRGPPRPRRLATGAWQGLLLENERPVVGPFEWRTVAIATSRPWPRCAVSHLAGHRGPGFFVVSTQGVDESLKGAFYPPGSSRGSSIAGSRVGVTVRDRKPRGARRADEHASWGRGGAPRFTVVREASTPADAMERARVEGGRSLPLSPDLSVGPVAASRRVSVLGPRLADRSLSRQRSTFLPLGRPRVAGTPLAGIRVYADMLAGGTGDPAHTERYARHVAGEAERLGRVVSRFATRASSGVTLQVRPEPGDIAMPCAVCQRLTGGVEAAGARIDLVIDPRSPECASTATPSFTFVQNLLDNAERYARDASDSTIRVRASRPMGGAWRSGGRSRTGIPANRVGGLFRPFRRGDDRDAPPRPRTGPDTRPRLAAAHEGTVSYRDATGAGPSSRFRLPGDGGEKAVRASIPLRQPVRPIRGTAIARHLLKRLSWSVVLVPGGGKWSVRLEEAIRQTRPWLLEQEAFLEPPAHAVDAHARPGDDPATVRAPPTTTYNVLRILRGAGRRAPPAERSPSACDAGPRP